jgi:hypothetical protein
MYSHASKCTRSQIAHVPLSCSAKYPSSGLLDIPVPSASQLRPPAFPDLNTLHPSHPIPKPIGFPTFPEPNNHLISSDPTPKPIRFPKAIDPFLQPLFKIDTDWAAFRDLVRRFDVIVSLSEAFVRRLLVAFFERFLGELPMAAGVFDDAEADETHCGVDCDVLQKRCERGVASGRVAVDSKCCAVSCDGVAVRACRRAARPPRV